MCPVATASVLSWRRCRARRTRHPPRAVGGGEGRMTIAQPAGDTAPAFGTLLRRHRLAAGLTQEELAERASLSKRSISDIERGVPHTPRKDTVALLADALALAPAD